MGEKMQILSLLKGIKMNCKDLLSLNSEWIKSTLSKVDGKLSAVAVRSRGKLVDGVEEDGVTHKSVKPTAWTSGFFGGLMTLMYSHTQKQEYLETAKVCEKLLDTALIDFASLYHDVGFMWHILSGALYRLTGDETSKNRNLHAAAALYARFIPDGKFIRAWNPSADPGRDTSDWTIIDCMMNLPILYWAGSVVKDNRFDRVAMLHADNTIRTHLREDGSAYHIIKHDRMTGDKVCTIQGQGMSPDSAWTRGQAWAIYGFVLSYLATGEKRYLDASLGVADYFIKQLNDDWIPVIDFHAPKEPLYYDSTAGMIAACGFIELAGILGDDEGAHYLDAAINIIKAECDRFADFDPSTDVMLSHGSVRYPAPGMFSEKEAGVHIPIIYGEYFFVEALLKLSGSNFNPWVDTTK